MAFEYPKCIPVEEQPCPYCGKDKKGRNCNKAFGKE